MSSSGGVALAIRYQFFNTLIQTFVCVGSRPHMGIHHYLAVDKACDPAGGYQICRIVLEGRRRRPSSLSSALASHPIVTLSAP